jgi:N-acyl-D-amino-acid deacylase
VYADFDFVIRGGTIYDGSGAPPFSGDVGIAGDRVTAVGRCDGRAANVIDADGLAVTPGFINMLSGAAESLLRDGRAMSDLFQGVTLEVLGEGNSMGPVTPALAEEMAAMQDDFTYPITWTTLRGYLEQLVQQGVSPNIASFVGATTIRQCILGSASDRPPTADELSRMSELADRAMAEGALGVSSALIYPPACFAATNELVALARAGARRGGMYISHIRSEGDRMIEALDEFLAVTRLASVRSEVYHLKFQGRRNWGLVLEVTRKIADAHAAGLQVTANAYPYEAGASTLDVLVHPDAFVGGTPAMLRRLADPRERSSIRDRLLHDTSTWENMYANCGGASGVVLASFGDPNLRHLSGQTLADAAVSAGRSPEEFAFDLLIADRARSHAILFHQAWENVLDVLRLPYVSICSDSEACDPTVWQDRFVHPRAYGSFARVLGRIARDEKLFPLEEAVRRMTSLPAANLRLDRRGRIEPDMFADVAVFDPAVIADRATYDCPHQYAVGMIHVLVNGIPVIHEGQHTGALPGKVLHGPGNMIGGE